MLPAGHPRTHRAHPGDRGAISQRVARAEHAGLVQHAGAGDGSRAVVVTLTSAGHVLVESLVDRVLRREAELIAGLAPPQRDVLIELLRLRKGGS